MTALDRAIIKAYGRPLSHSATAVGEPPAAPPHVTMAPAVPLSQALAELATTPEAPLETFLSAPSRVQPIEDKAKCEYRLQSTATETAMAPVGPSIMAMLDEAQSVQATTVTESTFVISPAVDAFAAQTVQATTATAPNPAPVEIGETKPAPTEAIVITGVPLAPPPAFAVTASLGPVETSWRPLLQVDGVAWPSVLSRVQAAASGAVQQMVDGLLSICASGSKVLGLASCVSGEGVTTLLLAAARNLLGQGRKIAIVDANWNNPQMAQSLGLLPQIGWEETLCGGLPLEEVAIESLADGLAVLPVREPSASPIAQTRIAASLDILAREFDIVLVDLGSLAQVDNESTSADAGAPSRGVATRMDGIILVQNVRLTTPNRLAEARQGLASANLRHVGTIQNFVAE